jgi:hypothetical protein
MGFSDTGPWEGNPLLLFVLCYRTTADVNKHPSAFPQIENEYAVIPCVRTYLS